MADYCTIEEVRTELAKQGVTQVDEDAIVERIPRSTGLINSYCHHSFDDEVVTNEFRAGSQVLMSPDGILTISASKGNVQSITSASVSQDLATWTTLDATKSWTSGDTYGGKFVMNFFAPTAPVNRLSPTFARISYRGGFAPDSSDATVITGIAARWTAFLFLKREAPFDVTAFPAVGQVSVPSAMPSDLAKALVNYVRRRV
jgi:hypothetical protein